MLLDKPAIARLIPHVAEMVLLDAVLACDATSIHCTASGHHDLDHPLRERGRLASWCGIEYAAQAMAVHHGLNQADAAGGTPTPGVLAMVRDVEMLAPALDAAPGVMHIHAEKILAGGNHLLYQFHLQAVGKLIVRGRATVVMQRVAA